MDSFDGKIVLITGGASGIGEATAELLADRGARVCIADLPSSPGSDTAARLGGIFTPVDVGDSHAVDVAFDSCERELGGLDIAFLNAGVTTNVADPTELTDDMYHRIMRVNVDGVIYGTRAAARALTRRGGGAIVATASLAGLVAFPPDPVYVATKHAVVGWIRSVAPTLATQGITCNCICPGFVDTPLLSEVRDTFVQAGFPLLDKSEIAATVVAVLQSDATGQAWVCQPGRAAEPFRFPNTPGPRTAGSEGAAPPELLQREWPH